MATRPLALLSQCAPDVILMDGLMPGMDGFTACARLQEMPEYRDIPVLMITALDDNQSIEQAFAVGASDYLTKPIHLAVVQQRVRRVVDATRTSRHVRHLAYHDTVTDLPNRAQFSEELKQAIERAERTDHALALLFLDLDRFKFVNDTLGHEIGDRLLKLVGQRIRHCVRSSDSVARLGGDEFTVLLDELPDPAAAANAAQKIERALGSPFEIEGHDIFISTSIGISLFPGGWQQRQYPVAPCRYRHVSGQAGQWWIPVLRSRHGRLGVRASPAGECPAQGAGARGAAGSLPARSRDH